jgi:hypothetical protein
LYNSTTSPCGTSYNSCKLYKAHRLPYHPPEWPTTAPLTADEAGRVAKAGMILSVNDMRVQFGDVSDSAMCENSIVNLSVRLNLLRVSGGTEFRAI